MSPTEELSYIQDLKSMILADARALYSAHGLTSRTVTFEVMTSKHAGAYQATLIIYPDLSANTCWSTLYDGLKCTNMCAAMKMLWDGVQTQIGEMKAMQYQALMSPTSTSTMDAMSPVTATFDGEATTATEATTAAETSARSPLIANGTHSSSVASGREG